MFLEAESYFLYEEYNEALPLYIQLSQLYPKNDNINYRLGLCYLNIPYEKAKAITYLDKATKNINPKYKASSLKETAAPPDAVYYLGDAYRVNNQLEKAIALYKRFKQSSSPEEFDHQMVDNNIRACENALILQKQPILVTYSNLGENINTRFSENNAVISGDEATIVYSSRLQFYHAVFFSVKKNGNWSEPVNINPDLLVDDDCFPVGISYDGRELILYRNDDDLGDLYVSRLINGKWSKIKKLNSNINTKYWESHACLSRDGKKLFFTSNRKDSYGGLDIYIASRTDVNSDNWGQPRNLGNTVNSPLNEETPFITADDQKLYFSSLGHNGMGGYDIFVSQAGSDGSWSKPQNVGYPLNTTDHDLFYQPLNNGNEGYIALAKNDSYGRNDIYKIQISVPEDKLATLNKKLKEPEDITPSSEVDKSIQKQEKLQKIEEQAEFIAEITQKDEPAVTIATLTSAEVQDEKIADTFSTESEMNEEKPVAVIQTKNPDEDSTLSPGQRNAWHKLLYGGLGVLVVFVFFILFLYRKSRKRNNKQNI